MVLEASMGAKSLVTGNGFLTISNDFYLSAYASGNIQTDASASDGFIKLFQYLLYGCRYRKSSSDMLAS